MVTRASPFDALWDQARAAVNGHLAQLEPEAALFTTELLTQALRRARVREVAIDDGS